jgi:pathogenesis-related protein 1
MRIDVSTRAAALAIVALGGCPKAESTPSTSPTTASSLAEPTAPPRSEAEPGERGRLAGLTAAHNDARAEVGVPPLKWSRELARHAQSWAEKLAKDGCALEHRRDDPYGENLYWSSGAASASAVVAKWAAEASGYNHRRNSCKGVCGHYTQMVWSDTRSLGCGVASCDNGEVWVCNYDPPGNVVGQSPH